MKKLIPSAFILVLVLITSQLAYTYSGSAPPAGYTNAPGENNCTNCHSSFPLATSGILWDAITLTTSVPLSSLLPNTTYTFSLTFANAASSKYGFEMVALPSSATTTTPSIGTLVATSPETELQLVNGREYLSHSATGTAVTGGSKTWTFDYTTPSAFAGGLNFYVVVNSTNSNSGSDDDLILAKVFSSNVLPVKWLSYGVKVNQGVNIVEWSTASESNNDYFEIERSTDAINWEKIAVLKSKGNGNTTHRYAYKDEDLTFTKGFYRIKQVDFNGRFDYSKILPLDKDNNTEYVRYNSDSKLITISNSSQWAPAMLFTLAGMPIAKCDNGTTIDVSFIENGIYLLQLPSGAYQKILIY